MREIEVSKITDVVEKLCIEANEHLPEDVKCAIKDCRGVRGRRDCQRCSG